MIIDTHSHLQFKAFKGDVDEVAERTIKEDIWTINVGTKYETSQGAIAIAEKYGDGFFAAVGLHPMYAAAEFIKLKTDPDEGEFLIREQDFDAERYRQLARLTKVMAIGEIGLDYYYRPKTAAKLQQFKEKQRQVFLQQVDLAKELHLPLILHCRMAHDDLIEIVKLQKGLSGVIHCFTGTVEQAKKYIDLGFYIGLNGIIFKLPLDQVVAEVPLEHMVVETDCPYLTPPQGASQRNEPMFIKHTIQKIAELKGISFEEVCATTTQNARKLFNF